MGRVVSGRAEAGQPPLVRAPSHPTLTPTLLLKTLSIQEQGRVGYKVNIFSLQISYASIKDNNVREEVRETVSYLF